MLHLKSPMLSSSILLGLSCSFLATTLALPTEHTPAESKSSIANIHATGKDVTELIVSRFLASKADDSEPIPDEHSELSEQAMPVEETTKPSIVPDSLMIANASMPILTANNPPQCWPGRPTSRARNPVSNPSDCNKALSKIMTGHDHIRAPIEWRIWDTWAVGSCQIRLLPAVVVSRDTFSRYDIYVTASRIIRSCVDEAHGFRGGILGIGGGRMFDISVEANRKTPFQPDQVSGVSES